MWLGHWLKRLFGDEANMAIRVNASLVYRVYKRSPSMFRPASKRFLRWLEQKQVPEPLIAVFRVGVTRDGDALPGVDYSLSEKDIMAKDWEGFADQGLLLLGQVCEDLLAVDFGEGGGATGYLCHETMWDNLRAGKVRQSFAAFAPSLGLALRKLNGRDYPGDYWAAKELQEARGRKS
jgi:hypothetical protein